jgi:hypothetical protein
MSPQERREGSAELQRLRSELGHAHEIFEYAKQEFHTASERVHELGLLHPEGMYALHGAVAAYGYALEQYADAVKRCADSVLAQAAPSASEK